MLHSSWDAPLQQIQNCLSSGKKKRSVKNDETEDSYLVLERIKEWEADRPFEQRVYTERVSQQPSLPSSPEQTSINEMIKAIEVISFPKSIINDDELQG